MLKSKICCERMKEDVVYSKKGMYENADIIIVSGKNPHTDELSFLVHDKNTRETLPLGVCIFCHKEVGW
jgi:hypothetical protein